MVIIRNRFHGYIVELVSTATNARAEMGAESGTISLHEGETVTG